MKSIIIKIIYVWSVCDQTKKNGFFYFDEQNNSVEHLSGRAVVDMSLGLDYISQEITYELVEWSDKLTDLYSIIEVLPLRCIDFDGIKASTDHIPIPGAFVTVDEEAYDTPRADELARLTKNQLQKHGKTIEKVIKLKIMSRHSQKLKSATF